MKGRQLLQPPEIVEVDIHKHGPEEEEADPLTHFAALDQVPIARLARFHHLYFCRQVPAHAHLCVYNVIHNYVHECIACGHFWKHQ